MREVRITDRTSHSELSKLAMCEAMWGYSYRERKEASPDADTTKRDLGSAFHLAANAFWQPPQDWRAVLQAGEWPEATRDHAEWLMGRYEEVYTPARDAQSIRMIGFEIKLVATIPGSRTELVSYLDNLALDRAGDMWLVERKTMGDWRRLDWLPVDPQITRYVWQAQQAGLPIKGVLYDAARTYRWKRDEHKHPAHESFEVRWLLRSDDEIAESVEEMRGQLRRRGVLLNGERPTRNIGSTCGWCDYAVDCWESLQFPYDRTAE